ncbi:MAG: phosphatidylglycerophosphatase A [Candidatus Omnitrophota bacterium]|jgi:CDP-diacylglycerol--glycerol-3-phosphate 3-phosphatidyltransferase
MTSWAKYKYSFLNPNVLSIARGLIGLSLPFLILRPSPSGHLWAFILFMVGAITDYFDGWIARQYKLESDFGRWVDPFSDKILILAPMAAFATLHFYSIWWVVPIFIREILVTFCRTGWLLGGKSLGAEMMGKLKFGFQTVTVWIAFVYLLLNPYSVFDWVTGIFHYLLPVFLITTVALTIVSGGMFLWNQRAHFGSEAFNKFVLAMGVGLFPKAPGTWGSLLGVLLVFLTRWNGGLYGVVFVFLVVWGALAYERVTDPAPDPQYIVIDEVCGIFVTFMMIPMTWFSAILGFVLFRIFDVFKPFPVRSLERIPRYWGIMADDLGAGLYAWIILFVIFK